MRTPARWHQATLGRSPLKEHVREPYKLAPDVQREHFREVMRAAEAFDKTFKRG